MSRLGQFSFLFSAISLLAMTLVRYLAGDWVPFCWIALGLCGFFILLGFFIDRVFFKEFFTMKTTKHGMNMGALISLVLALLVVVNFIAIRKYKVFDFSLSKQNTLSEQSIKLLKNLDADLRVRFFYKKGVESNEENRRLFRELVKKYQDQNDKVQLDFVEVNERPDLATEYGVDKGSGVVFMEYKGRKNRIDKIDEQELSSALVKVTRDKKKTLYFTSGHGELSLDEVKEANGANALKLLLESNNYTVKNWASAQNSKIPEDMDMLIVAGPKQSFLDFEVASIVEYLRKGGSLLAALDSQQNTGLDPLLRQLGIQLQNNYVWNLVETPMGNGINQGPVIGTDFSKNNEIVSSFGKDEITLFLHPTGLRRLENTPKNLQYEDLVKTTAASVGFNKAVITGAGDKGPFTLVTQVKGQLSPEGSTNKKDPDNKNEKSETNTAGKEFTAIIAGDSHFLNNQLLFKNLNRDLVLNSIASLVKEQSLISISPKEPQRTELTLTRVNFTFFIFGFIIPLPLLLLGTSVGLWYRRRNA